MPTKKVTRTGPDSFTGRKRQLHEKLFRELRGEMWTRVLDDDGWQSSEALQEIVEDSGLSRQTIRKVMNGHENIMLATLESLCFALGKNELFNTFHSAHNRPVTKKEADRLRRSTGVRRSRKQ